MARERGSVTLWAAGVTMLAMAAAAVLAQVAVSGAARGRAQGAADLAALAGADGGPAAARAVARRNGAEVIAVDEVGGRVEVRVRRDGVVAEAAAVPGDPPESSEGEMPSPEGHPLDSLRGVQPP